MRSAQLLTVAAQYPEFPIVLETMRECLNDVFDLDGLLEVQRQVASRSLRIVEVETRAVPVCPLAALRLRRCIRVRVMCRSRRRRRQRSRWMHAAGRAARQGWHQAAAGCRHHRSIEADLQCLSAERQVSTLEQAFDLLRTAGPFTRLSWRRELTRA